MKFSRIVFFLVLSVLVVFSSCKEDEISKDIVTEQQVVPETVTFNPLVANVQASVSSTGGLDLGCFTINFPFALSIGGVEVAINSEEDFQNAINDNPDQEYIDFVYPLDITYPDGTVETADSGEALGEAFASCVPDTGWTGEEGFPAFLICELNSCYEIVYPLNLLDVDGNTYIVTTEEEFIDQIANNPNLYFEFPISLINMDGETVTAQSDQDLMNLLLECDPIEWPQDTITYGGGYEGGFACYDIGYPASLVDVNGNTITVENNDAFWNALFNNEIIDFGYPLTLIDEDGVAIEIGNGEELTEALEECGGVIIEGDVFLGMLFEGATNLGFGNCYEVLFPVVLNNPQAGTTLTLNSNDDLTENIFNEFWIVELPVNINVDGEVVVIDDIQVLFDIQSTCQGNNNSQLPAIILYQFSTNLGTGDCYDMVYPINLYDYQGNTLVVNNDQEAGESVNSSELWFVDYPVTLVIDGVETIVEEWQEMDVILEVCQ